ncbi:MAG: hypothetical protein J6K88_03790 [Oscillospiraceae bacterium]|nr:hypothetical protein [Oscillospiraceae bacterium]
MKKIIFTLLMCLLFLFSFSYIPIKEPFDESLYSKAIVAQQQSIVKIGFSNHEPENEDLIETVLTIKELQAWKNPYEQYRSSVIYNTLTSDEKLVYRALEYALVNSYRYTHIDYRIPVSENTVDNIIEYLSLDSPLLEQNLLYSTFSQTAFYYHKAPDGRTVKVRQRGISISVSNFSKELWDKKMLALEEAKKVYESLNTGGTQIELAERLYRYVAQNIVYFSYVNEKNWYKGDLAPFLYDAFINKKTHCDGFSNALALLFSLAGFEHVEKSDCMNVEVGHTWNCVKLDGIWYNCDGTAGEWIPQNSKTMGSGLYFAFGDYMEESIPDHDDRMPDCSQSLYMQPDGFLPSCNDPSFYNIIYNGFAAHQQEWALVVVDEYSESAFRKQLQRLANAYSTSIYFNKIDVKDDKTVLLILSLSIY